MSNKRHLLDLDLTPLYSTSIGFDRLGSMLTTALNSEDVSRGYPPYNIEMLEQDKYSITLAVAGFKRSELSITSEKGILTIQGQKEKQTQRNFLHQGIANRSFEKKFNLADYVEVRGADLTDGLLTISLVREIPEAMKPKTIAITGDDQANVSKLPNSNPNNIDSDEQAAKAN